MHINITTICLNALCINFKINQLFFLKLPYSQLLSPRQGMNDKDENEVVPSSACCLSDLNSELFFLPSLNRRHYYYYYIASLLLLLLLLRCEAVVKRKIEEKE